MGSGTPSTVTQTNSTQLSAQQQQIADAGYKYLSQYTNSNLSIPGMNVTDPTVLGFDPLETQGQNDAVSAANGSINDLAKQAASTNSFLMDPSLLSPDSNPYLKAQGDAIAEQTTRNLNQNILPGLRSGAAVSGGFNSGGNTRGGLAQGEAVGQTNQDLTNALSNLYGGAYQSGLSTLGSAIDRNPAVMSGLLAPATITAGVGDQRRELAQAQSNQTVNNANNDAALQQQVAWLQQQLPFLQAQQIYGLLGAVPGGTGVSTTTGAQPQTSLVGGALGGAASGAAVGSIIPGIGTTVGGGLGGLLGLVSSIH